MNPLPEVERRQIAIAATTSATVSGVFRNPAQMRSITVQVTTSGADFAGSEMAVVEYTTDGGVTYKELLVDGTVVALSATNRALTVSGPLVFRLNKTATAGAVGLTIVAPVV